MVGRFFFLHYHASMSSIARTALALTHVLFEDLGSLAPVLEAQGFSVTYVAATATPFPAEALASADLVVVLGGPIGVYDSREYPFLNDEIQAIRARLDARKPTLGICLGAQLMAAALGARVYAGSSGSEIGWSPIHPPADTAIPAWFGHLCSSGVEVFHWHGDTFDLPDGARLLASTQSYDNQAFMLDNFALALQFHPEVTADGLESWYVGHACELHTKKIDVAALRTEGRRKTAALYEASKSFWEEWLSYIL